MRTANVVNNKGGRCVRGEPVKCNKANRARVAGGAQARSNAGSREGRVWVGGGSGRVNNGKAQNGGNASCPVQSCPSNKRTNGRAKTTSNERRSGELN